MEKQTLSNLNKKMFALQGIYWCSICAIVGFPMIFFVNKGFSYFQTCVIIAAYNLCSALIQPTFSSILQRFRKLSVKDLLSILLGIAILFSVILFFLTPKFVPFLIIFTILSTAQYAALSLLNSFAMEYINIGIPVNFGLARGGGSAAYAFCSLFLGLLISRFDENVLVIMNVIFLILCILLLRSFQDASQLKDTVKTKPIEVPESYKEHAPSLFVFRKQNPIFMNFLIAIFFLHIACTFMGTGFAPNYISRYNGTVSDAGIVIFCSALSELPIMASFNFLSKKIRLSYLLIFSSTAYILKSFGTLLAPNVPSFAAIQLIQGISYGLFYVSSVLFTNKIVNPGDRVLAQGLLFSVFGIGSTTANLIAGVILEAFNVNVLAWSCVVFSVIGTIITVMVSLAADKKYPERLNLF